MKVSTVSTLGTAISKNEELRQSIARDTEVYLAAGGQIETLPTLEDTGSYRPVHEVFRHRTGGTMS